VAMEPKAEPKQKIDAAAILASLDRNDLAEQITAAKARVDEATAELRSLQTLEKVRAMRAGELKRKPQQPRKKKATADAEPIGQPVDLRTKIVAYLRREGRPMKPNLIAVGLGESVAKVVEAIEADVDTFRKAACADGSPGVALRG
jgi:hypothetical protein